jgi:hypothetical protein
LIPAIHCPNGKQAKITVDPKLSSWTVDGKKASYQGLGSPANASYPTPTKPVGALIVLDGNRKIYGFDKGSMF